MGHNFQWKTFHINCDLLNAFTLRGSKKLIWVQLCEKGNMFHIFSKKENAKVNWCDFYYFILLHFPVVREKSIKETKYVGIPGLLCNPIKNLIKAPIWNGYGTLSLSDRRRKKQTSSSASMKPPKQPKLGISMLRKSNLLSKLFYNPITWWWLYLHCNQRLFLLLNFYFLNGGYFQFQRILIKHWLIFATQQTKLDF